MIAKQTSFMPIIINYSKKNQMTFALSTYIVYLVPTYIVYPQFRPSHFQSSKQNIKVTPSGIGVKHLSKKLSEDVILFVKWKKYFNCLFFNFNYFLF